MIERSPDAWVQGCYCEALTFYLQEQSTLPTNLLTVLIPQIDHSRVVRTFRQIT